jgi:cytochrome c553
MKHKLAYTLLFAGALGVVATAQADSRTRTMAANCSYCHGPDGKSRGAIPSLAGLEKGYFAQQMKDFKSGTRPSVVMQKHALGYTDEEIEQLAAWFAAVK